MRKAAHALCLTLLVAGCRSSSPRDDDQPAEAPLEAETGMEGQEGEPEIAPREALDQEWERLSLEEQKRAFLVEQHIEKARELRDALRLTEAEAEIAAALELDPDNATAQAMRQELNALQGRGGVADQSVSDELQREYELKQQQLVEEARDNIRRGNVYLARGQYDQAIVEFNLALDHIRWAPFSVDWQDLDKRARELLETAKSQKEIADATAREEAERNALAQLKEIEEAERNRQRQIVATMLDQAIAAFRAERYDDAIEYANRVLREEPRNERALDIRDTAFRAGREKVRDDYLRNKREQYQRWQEDMLELRVPYNEVVTLPDEDFWNQITELRARRPGIDLSTYVDPTEVELRNRLDTTSVLGLRIEDEESLTAVVDAVRVITDLPLVVDPLAEQAAVDDGVVYDINLTAPLPASKVLNLIDGLSGANVTWTVRHDAIIFTTTEKARGELEIYNHDVQDLIFGLTDFLGPRIDRLRLVDDLEDEDGGGPFGGIGERPTINEPDDLATLVQDNVANGTWSDEGVSIQIEAGNMVVVHTPAVQMQVRQFLEDLRRFSASLVTIESKFMTIADNFLQEIGVDFRGIDNPGTPFTDLDDVTFTDASLGLDNSGDGVTPQPPSSGFFYDDGGDGDFKGRTENLFDSPLGSALTNIGGLTAQWTFLNDLQLSAILRLVEKNENIELINDQVLSVHNTQRAFVTVINQRAYVQDFDVEVAQFQAIADPVINVLTEGIVLDVRPTIHHDRRYLTLEIQPTVARVVSLTDFSTTLAGQTAAVTFQLPELEVQSVFTTAVVPDGGSILIGGLSRVRNIERRAEVPWIANVPLVGFFFKTEGFNDEKSSLMIMIRAWITDVKQELARLEQR